MKTEHTINRVFILATMCLLLFIACVSTSEAAMSRWSSEEHSAFFEHLYEESFVADSATKKMNYTFYISCIGSFYSQKYSYDEWYDSYTAEKTTEQQDYEFRAIQNQCKRMIEEESACIGKSCKRTRWI
jgi:hypothetical protein